MFTQSNRVFKQTNKLQITPQREPYGLIPRWMMERTLGNDCNYKRWLRARFGAETAERLVSDYYIGGNTGDADAAIFWQVDHKGEVRTGKVMNYDATTGKRLKGEAAYVNWIHSIMQREGALPEGWELRQCLYGEHLLRQRPDAFVALAEGAKTAHIGAVLMPELVWVAVDAMLAISEERLAPLKGRRVILFPDEGRGYREWSERIAPIAHAVGFSYTISDFMQRELPNTGGDIGDLALN